MHRKTKNNLNANKRLRNLIFLIICIVIIYLIIYFVPKNYEFNYKVDGYTIIEKYSKKDKMYTFTVEKKDKKYEFISTNKYNPNRKLIRKLEEFNDKKTSCIVIDSDILDMNIYCVKNNEMIDYRLTKVIPKKYIKKNNSKNIKYQDIKLNLVDDKSYFIWNYTGFYKIANNTKEKISVFKEDVYNLDINVIIDKYLILADYDQKYNFNKFKMINLDNNEIEEIEFDYEISFDSRIIGTYKNSFYLIDEKNKKEYEINIKKKNVEIISKNKYGKILKDNEFEKVKINKIITDDLKFEYNQYYSWNIDDDNLYLIQKGTKNRIKVSNNKIKNIVYFTDTECYYVVDDNLYKYSFKYGEEKVLSYFELNFNYENMIYIYE